MRVMLLRKSIGVGIVGCGKISDFHANALRSIPEKASIVANFDVAETLMISKARQWGSQPSKSYEALLKRQDLDAVILLTPHNLHADMAVSAAEAGKHILCEKPLATTIPDADRMIAAAESAGVKLMTAFNRRFVPLIQRTKKLIDGGDLGEVFLCTGQSGGSVKYPAGSWRISPSISGGGAIVGELVHYIDLFRWLLGREVTAVFCNSVNLAKPMWDVEDNALVVLRFQDGVVGYAFTNFSETTPYWDERFKVSGTQGVAEATLMRFSATPELDFGTLKVHRGDARDGWTHSDFGNQRRISFQSEVEHFVDCILNDTEPMVTGEDGRVALKVCLASYESARTGKWVRL